MSEQSIVLKGKVKDFIKSYSGNLSFMLEDSNGNLHYCFSTKKKPLLSPSDKVVVIGSPTSGNKVRINYLINQSRNTEENMLEGSSDWMYYLSLISAILVTIGFVVGLLIVFRFIPIDFGPVWGIIGSIYSMMIFLIIIIAGVPLMIIFWVLTNLFAKKRKGALQLSEDIFKIKENLSGSFKSTIKSSEAIKEPISELKEQDLSVPRPQFCANCGEKLSFEAKFCPSCGSEQ